MKKIMLLMMAVIMIGINGVHAQSTTKAATQTTTTTAKHVTKTGTPDKRYKENKTTTTEAKATAGPVKKDGTPDMRYKSNKTTTKTVSKAK